MKMVDVFLIRSVVIVVIVVVIVTCHHTVRAPARLHIHVRYNELSPTLIYHNIILTPCPYIFYRKKNSEKHSRSLLRRHHQPLVMASFAKRKKGGREVSGRHSLELRFLCCFALRCFALLCCFVSTRTSIVCFSLLLSREKVYSLLKFFVKFVAGKTFAHHL